MAMLFKLPGVLLAAYILWAVLKGEVYIKAGIRGYTVERRREPPRFWTGIAIYTLLALALALLFVF